MFTGCLGPIRKRNTLDTVLDTHTQSQGERGQANQAAVLCREPGVCACKT